MQRKIEIPANQLVSREKEESVIGSYLSFFCLPCIGVTQAMSACVGGEEKKKAVIAVDDLEHTYPHMIRN